MADAAVPPKTPKTPLEKESAQRLIVVLEKACLETVKAGNSYELLNCDDHIHILRKHKRDPADVRPDICHQVWLDEGCDFGMQPCSHLAIPSNPLFF